MRKKLTFHTLDDLRLALAIPPINTGRRINLFGHRAGVVTDDIDALHVILDEQGRVRFMSGVEFSMQLYRAKTLLPCPRLKLSAFNTQSALLIAFGMPLGRAGQGIVEIGDA